MTGISNMAGYTAEQLIKSAREDAFHGVMMVVALHKYHPLRATLQYKFEEILNIIDTADWK